MNILQADNGINQNLWLVVPGLGSFGRFQALRLHLYDEFLIRERQHLEPIFKDLGLPPILQLFEGIDHPDWLSPLAIETIATFVHNLLITRVLVDIYGCPDHFIGYSLGEVVLATLSGIYHEYDIIAWLIEVSKIIERETVAATCFYANKPFGWYSRRIIHDADISVFLDGVNSHLAACPAKHFSAVSAYFMSNDAVCAPIGINYGFHTQLINSAFSSFKHIRPRQLKRVGEVAWYSCSRGRIVTSLDSDDLWSVFRNPFTLNQLAELSVSSPELLVLEFGPVRALSGFPEVFPTAPVVNFRTLFSSVDSDRSMSIASRMLSIFEHPA